MIHQCTSILSINKHLYTVLKFNILSLKDECPGNVETTAQGHLQGFVNLAQGGQTYLNIYLAIAFRMSGLGSAGVCFQEHELSAGPGMCFPNILNRKGPERQDCVCFGLVPITRIIKIHSRGTSTLSTVCPFQASLKNVD